MFHAFHSSGYIKYIELEIYIYLYVYIYIQVVCETLNKPIELEEICIDIDIQLPREECRKESREECRYISIQKRLLSVSIFDFYKAFKQH